MLLHSEVGSAIVFSRTKHGADRLARQLKARGHSVAALHGDRTQSQRERALSDLKRGRVQIMVATDIASRGIDVNDISHVINFDVPHSPEDYVHRIGRTGRVQAVGDAFTLMSPEEKSDVAAIEKFLGKAIPRVTLPDFDYKKSISATATHAGRRGSEGGGHDSHERGRGRREHGESRGAAHAGGHSGQSASGSARGGGQAGAEPSHGRRPQRDASGRRRRKM
jgi:ATP-dependent RNA helicase RhlE